jgi:hypothetical protein
MSAHKTEIRDPKDLKVHHLLHGMPEWADTDPRLKTLTANLRDEGMIEPLKITPDGKIADGRHRWRGAKRLQWKEVPVIVVPEDRVAEIIVSSLLQRRHFTAGQRAYMLAGVIDDAFAEAQRRMLATQNNHSAVAARNSVSSRGKTPEDYADEIGVSVQYLRLARWLQDAFKDTKKRTLTDDDGNTEKGVTFREFYEPRLLREEKPYGLGPVKRGVEYLQQADKDPSKKAGGKPKEKDRQLSLFNQVVTDELNRWEYWQKFDEEDRAEHFKAVRSKCADLEPKQLEELAEYHTRLAAEFRKAAKHGKGEA